MPPYLKLGSLPRKRHIAHKNEPGYRNEGIYYEEVVTTQGFSRAYSICYHLEAADPGPQVVEAAGTITVETVDQLDLAAYPSENRQTAFGRRSDHRPSAIFGQ